VCTLILEAQVLGEPVIWVSGIPTVFFPPDMAANGVDLAALPVVRAARPQDAAGTDRSPRSPTASPERAAARAALHLVRSGGFGLIIMDLDRPLHHTITGKLARIAKATHTALLILTPTPGVSGSMASLRGETRLRRGAPGLFACELRITKDTRHGGYSRITEVCHAPDGVC
jgi:recombination protein RecA